MLKLRFINRERTEIIWKTDPSEIERTYNIRKQQTRFNWVCSWELMESATTLTPACTGLSSLLLSVRTQYSWRTRIWKKINTIYRCTGRSFTNTTCHNGQQLLRPLNNLENGSVRSRETYNIEKQQTQFYWVCSWELMKSTTILMPPCTGLSSSLLSARTQYSWRTRIWKNYQRYCSPLTVSGQVSDEWLTILRCISFPSKAVLHDSVLISMTWITNINKCCFFFWLAGA